MKRAHLKNSLLLSLLIFWVPGYGQAEMGMENGLGFALIKLLNTPMRKDNRQLLFACGLNTKQHDLYSLTLTSDPVIYAKINAQGDCLPISGSELLRRHSCLRSGFDQMLDTVESLNLSPKERVRVFIYSREGLTHYQRPTVAERMAKLLSWEARAEEMEQKCDVGLRLEIQERRDTDTGIHYHAVDAHEVMP